MELIAKIDLNHGLKSAILITMTTIIFICAFITLISIPIILIYIIYRIGKKIWCDKYKLFISDHEKDILKRMLKTKSDSIENEAVYRVKPKKIHITLKKG